MSKELHDRLFRLEQRKRSVMVLLKAMLWPIMLVLDLWSFCDILFFFVCPMIFRIRWETVFESNDCPRCAEQNQTLYPS